MYVVVRTNNEDRGSDCVEEAYGPYCDYDDALNVCSELSAHLPGEYLSHDEYPVEYTVVTLVNVGVRIVSPSDGPRTVELCIGGSQWEPSRTIQV